MYITLENGGVEDASGTVKVYVNKILVGTGKIGGEYDVYFPGIAAIGNNIFRSWEGEKAFKGIIDETRIYDMALSAEEICTPLLEKAETSSDGGRILLTFDKEMKIPPAAPAGFAVTINGVSCPITAVNLNAANKKMLELNLNRKIYKDTSNIRVSYTQGTVSSTDGFKLKSFNNWNVINKSLLQFPTLTFTQMPSGIHKMENNLVFNIKASDPNPEDNILNASMYINGAPVDFLAKNLATGQIIGSLNGQLSMVNGIEYEISINKSEYIARHVDNFSLKVIIRDTSNAEVEKTVSLSNYNTSPSILLNGLNSGQKIPKHQPDLAFELKAIDPDNIDQKLNVELYLVTSTDGEEIGEGNRKETKVNEFTANGKLISEGDLLNSNTSYAITLDKSILPNTVSTFILKIIVRDSCQAQGINEIPLIHYNALPVIILFDITDGQEFKKSNDEINFRFIIEDEDEVDINLETEIEIGVFNSYKKVTDYKINGVVNNGGVFAAQNGIEYEVTLSKDAYVPIYVNEFKMRVIATDTSGDKGVREISLIHYTDIMAKWSLDSVINRIAVDSGDQSNHGVIHGATLTTGIISNAFEFDGIDDYVEVPLCSALTITTNSFSVEAWVKTSDIPMANDGIVNNYRTPTIPYWGLSHLGDAEEDRGKFAFSLRDEKGQVGVIKTTTSFNDGQWHHLVGVRDAEQGKVKFYVDGVLAGEADAPSGNINSGQSVFIGEHGYRYFQGCIDEVALYGCVLSAEDVQQNYQKIVFLKDLEITNRYDEETRHLGTFGTHMNKIEFILTKTVNKLVLGLNLPSNINVVNIENVFKDGDLLENPVVTIVEGNKIVFEQTLTAGHYKIEFYLGIDDQLIVKTEFYSDEKEIKTNYESKEFRFDFSDFESLPNLL